MVFFTKQCEYCEKIFSKKETETTGNWKKKRFCSLICSSRTKSKYFKDPIAKLKNIIAETNKIESGCFELTRSVGGDGYGTVMISGKHLRTHRAVYHYLIGNIPEGLYVLHKCDNPKCINPDHLFLGTGKDNAIDMVNKGRAIRYGKKQLSKDAIRNIIELIESGKNHTEIAYIYNISNTYVSKIGLQNGFRRLPFKHKHKNTLNEKRGDLCQQ